MLSRIAYRIHTTLERYFPERRLFLKSDTDTRFIRLRSSTQAIAVVVAGVTLAWTVLATAILIFDSISAGTSRDQIARQQSMYEKRLSALSDDRDRRADEATRAQDRFALAMEQVSAMQSRLLASEDRRRELETGIDVIQSTLRRTIKERDAARSDADRAKAVLASNGGTVTEAGRARDTAATVAFLSDELGSAAQERDLMAGAAKKAAERVEHVSADMAAMKTRNEAIFSHLEEALTVSVEPLDKMFRGVGLSPEDLIASVRKGYSGQGGPLTPISFSTSNQPPSAEELRANAILKTLDELNMYRIAVFKTPLGMPVKTAVRFTSGYGGRDDPFGRGARMHEGQDLAGSYGAPIYATADGTVTYAGWENGYGRLIKVQHAFGIETRYGHLSQIRVEVGQRVSRGERIGDMGNSGRSTGTHLHYEVRLSGRAVNPMTFIKAATNVF